MSEDFSAPLGFLFLVIYPYPIHDLLFGRLSLVLCKLLIFLGFVSLWFCYLLIQSSGSRYPRYAPAWRFIVPPVNTLFVCFLSGTCCFSCAKLQWELHSRNFDTLLRRNSSQTASTATGAHSWEQNICSEKYMDILSMLEHISYHLNWLCCVNCRTPNKWCRKVL